MSESAFVFPALCRSDVVQLLNGVAATQPDQWVAAGPIYVSLIDEATGMYLDWEPHDVDELTRAAGARPEWGVQLDYRQARREQMLSIARVLLRDGGGVAYDDFCTHAWAPAEINADAHFAGARFGEGPVR
jgi:hypothetical protein